MSISLSEVDERARCTMRSMAWERAKGELKSMLCTHFREMESFQALDELIHMFISNVESNALNE